MPERPGYDSFVSMEATRGPLASQFAEQILDTTRPFRSSPDDALDVLDLGCGYGHTAMELARRCRSVRGLEPATQLAEAARAEAAQRGLANLRVDTGGVEDLHEESAYDLVVLDNVYEHLPDHGEALTRISRALRPGGTLFLLAPNRLWPMEAHYRLPFLAYLPLPAANRYLTWSGRGADYTDASYAPTLRSLRREFSDVPELNWQCVLPARRGVTMSGNPLHYRIGMRALDRFPALWAISKALLVVAVKR